MNVAGRKQSVCEREQIKGNLRSVVIVEKIPVMLKGLVEVKQYEINSDSEPGIVRFVHHRIQYHQ
jgi:hypothetical protein